MPAFRVVSESSLPKTGQEGLAETHLAGQSNRASGSEAEAGASRSQGLEARLMLDGLRARMFGRPRQEKLGRYELERRLGEGGMGIVYQARDPRLDRVLAIKLLRGDRDAPARARLAREARSLARLSHPNVVQVFDVGEQQNELYVVMEYLPGGDLRDWLRAKTRSTEEILGVFIAAGRGLAAAHATGVVHRDFKPQNVLIDDEGRPRVADFGLARVAVDPERGPESSSLGHAVRLSDEAIEDSMLTVSGSLMGTPAYMAPEQLNGEASGPAADQFAFCVACWEGLTGERPFTGRTLHALRETVMSGRIPRPAKRIPSHVEGALRRGLSIDPKKRFSGMGSLIEALEWDPKRRRRDQLFRGSVASLGAVAAFAAYLVYTGAGDPCRQARLRLTETWTAEASASLRGEFQAAGGIVADSLGPWLDAIDSHSEALGNSIDASCSEPGPPAQELAEMACLEERRVELETLVHLLSSGASAKDLGQHLADTPAELDRLGLESTDACLDARSRRLLPAAMDRRTQEQLQSVRLELARARVRWRSGDVRSAREEVEAALTRAKQLGYAPLEGEVLGLLGAIMAAQGDSAGAIDVLEQAIAIAEGEGDLKTEADARAALVGVQGFQRGKTGGAEEAGKRLRRSLDHLGQAAETSVGARLELQLSRTFAIAGRLDEALEAGKRAAKLQAKTGGASPEVLAQLGLSYAMRGDYPEAEKHLENAVTLLDQDPSEAVFVRGAMGMLRNFQGRDELASEALGAALKQAESSERAQAHYASIAASYLSQVRLRQGAAEEALELAQRGVQGLQERFGNEHPILGRALLHRGRAFAESGKLEEAEADFALAQRIWVQSHGAEHRAHAMPRTDRWRMLRANEPQKIPDCAPVREAAGWIEAAKETEPGHPAENARTYEVLMHCAHAEKDLEAAGQWWAKARDAWAQIGDASPPFQAAAQALAEEAKRLGLPVD